MNEKLKAARLNRGWSQEEAAEAAQVAPRTYQRWENGTHSPNFESRRLLRSAFGGAADEELGFTSFQDNREDLWLTLEERAALSELLTLGGNMAQFDAAKRKTLERLATLLGIAFTGSQFVEDLEARKQLSVASTHPVTLKSVESGFPSRIDETLIHHFGEETKLCWELLKVDGLSVVQQLLPTYLPALETLAQQPSQFRNVFAGLAAQGCMLAGLVAVLQLNTSLAETSCIQAVQYSRLAGDRTLEVAALKHLATKYNDAKYPIKTLHTYQKALPLVNQVSPLLCSRTYLGLALAFAQCGQKQEALRYLNMAQETFPERAEDDPGFSFADCGLSSLNHYGGLIYLEFGQPKDAWETFAGVEAIRSKIAVPERTVIEIVNCQAEAAVAQRDLELASAHIQRGVMGALQLKSEMRFNEAFSIYRQMKIIWPHESRVKALADLFQR